MSRQSFSKFIDEGAKPLFLSIIFLGVFLHCAGIFQPFLGNFGQHQTDYGFVVQKWLSTAINPLLPLSRLVAHGENRLFLGDIPLTMAITAYLCKYVKLSVEVAGRGLSIFFFILSLIPFYRLCKQTLQDNRLNAWAFFFYLISPLTIIYGQSFLLEMPALCFGLWGYWFFFKGVNKKSTVTLIASALCLSIMMSLRIYYSAVLIPLGLYYFSEKGWKILRDREVYFFFFLSLLLPLAWQGYAAYMSSATGHETSIQDNLRVFVVKDPHETFVTSQFVSYLPKFFDIFLTKIITPIGFVLALIGFFPADKSFKKAQLFLACYVLSYLLLFVVAPRKFEEFEYYYLPLVPAFAIGAAFCLKLIYNSIKSSKFEILLAILVILFSLRYVAGPVFVIPQEYDHVVKQGERVQEIVPADARIAASHLSQNLLFYSDRDGWPFSLKDKKKLVTRHQDEKERTAIERIELYRSQGADYFVLADKKRVENNPAFFEYLNQKYKLVDESTHGLIYSLK